MRDVMLCVTSRCCRVAGKLYRLGAGHENTVFGFREAAWAPAFREDILRLIEASGHRFHESRNLAKNAASLLRSP